MIYWSYTSRPYFIRSSSVSSCSNFFICNNDQALCHNDCLQSYRQVLVTHRDHSMQNTVIESEPVKRILLLSFCKQFKVTIIIIISVTMTMFSWTLSWTLPRRHSGQCSGVKQRSQWGNSWSRMTDVEGHSIVARRCNQPPVVVRGLLLTSEVPRETCYLFMAHCFRQWTSYSSSYARGFINIVIATDMAILEQFRPITLTAACSGIDRYAVATINSSDHQRKLLFCLVADNPIFYGKRYINDCTLGDMKRERRWITRTVVRPHVVFLRAFKVSKKDRS